MVRLSPREGLLFLPGVCIHGIRKIDVDLRGQIVVQSALRLLWCDNGILRDLSHG